MTPKTFIDHQTQYLLYAGGNRSKHAGHSLQKCIAIIMKNNLGFDTVSGRLNNNYLLNEFVLSSESPLQLHIQVVYLEYLPDPYQPCHIHSHGFFTASWLSRITLLKYHPSPCFILAILKIGLEVGNNFSP